MPAASRRASPARTISRWLGSSASAGACRCVRNIICDIRMIVLSLHVKRKMLPTKNTPSKQGQGVEDLRYHLCEPRDAAPLPHATMPVKPSSWDARPVITVGHRDGSPPPAQEWVRRRAGYRPRTTRSALCLPRSTATGLPQLLRVLLLLRAVYASGGVGSSLMTWYACKA